MMGLRLFCPDENAPIPRPVTLELTCDAMFCDGPTKPDAFSQQFTGSFMFEYNAARARKAPTRMMTKVECCLCHREFWDNDPEPLDKDWGQYAGKFLCWWCFDGLNTEFDPFEPTPPDHPKGNA